MKLLPVAPIIALVYNHDEVGRISKNILMTILITINEIIMIIKVIIIILRIILYYRISREKFEPEPGFEPWTTEFLARRSTT